MKNDKKYTLRQKFYQISQERLEAYLEALSEVNELIKNIRPDTDTDKVDWEPVNKAWSKVINLQNSLYGFTQYEQGEKFDDAYLYEEGVDLDNGKFYEIEFKNKDKN